MEVKKFYRTQREVASVVNEIIDQYWADNLTDEELEENIMIVSLVLHKTTHSSHCLIV